MHKEPVHVGPATASDDGRFIAVYHNSDTRVWDTIAATPVLNVPSAHLWNSRPALSPDGRVLATVGNGREEIILWSVGSGKQFGRLSGHKDMILSLVFCADSRTLISGGSDKTIRFWDVAERKEIRRIENQPFEVNRLFTSPDGRTIAVADFPIPNAHHRVRILDAATGQERYRLSSFFGLVAFSPDSKMLVTYLDRTFRVWDVTTGKELRSFTGHEENMATMVFSPDGRVLCSGGNDSVIRFWDPATGREAFPCTQLDRQIWIVKFSPDGKALATGERSGIIRVFEIKSGREVRQFKGHTGDIRALAYSADGRWIISKGADKTVRVWATDSGKEIRRFDGIPGYVGTLSPAGTRLATTDMKTVRIWDVTLGKELQHWEEMCDVPLIEAVFDSRDNVLLTATRERGNNPQQRMVGIVRARDLTRLTVLRQFSAELPGIVAYAFSADRTRVAISGEEERSPRRRLCMEIFDVGRGKWIQRISDLPGLAFKLTISPDNRLIAADIRDADTSRVMVWETITGRLRCEFVGTAVRALDFSPDSQLLATAGGEVLFWDLTRSSDDTKSRLELSSAELESLWTTLGNLDASQAHKAICVLTHHPRQSVSFLGQHLKPIPATNPENMERLIADLDSEKFSVRHAATQELSTLERLAEPYLLKALENRPSPEVRNRVEHLLSQLTEDCQAPGELRGLRAVEVLERIGTSDAKQCLQALAGGAIGSRQTQDARASLSRLSKYPPRPD
jgi:WD40 repeat protein